MYNIVLKKNGAEDFVVELSDAMNAIFFDNDESNAIGVIHQELIKEMDFPTSLNKINDFFATGSGFIVEMSDDNSVILSEPFDFCKYQISKAKGSQSIIEKISFYGVEK